MAYLKEFIKRIDQKDFQKFLSLWEEYCGSDTIEVDELTQLLQAIKSSEFSNRFGQVVETALPLWKTISNENDSYNILRLLIDIQSTNSPVLADLTIEALQKIHGKDPKFNERLRLVGLRNKDQFQGAIAKYDLIAHLEKGNAVFHTGGWGTGEIIDVSFVREHLIIEFENVGGRKDLSFANAFKTLIPLPNDNFLARRFLNPDQLEKEGKEDPVKLIKLLLRDLGAKSAAEIKEELCELVIPEKEWTKWWQGARAKLKKDPLIHTPDSLKEPFYIRKAEVSAVERLQESLEGCQDTNNIIQLIYNYVRDTSNALKDADLKKNLEGKLQKILSLPNLTEAQALSTLILLEQFFGYQPSENRIADRIKEVKNLDKLVDEIEIQAFKKRALIAARESRSDWDAQFLKLIFSPVSSQLRDYLLKELNQGKTKDILQSKIKRLLHHPLESPEMFVWLFQKLLAEDDEDLPYNSDEGRGQFLEGLLVLYHQIENKPEYRDLLKKMYNMISGQRYALVRKLLQGKSVEFIKEFLLLASKCQSLTDHDLKILRSLAEVVHPSLAAPKSKKGAGQNDKEIVWTTEEGYLKTQERVKQIGTVEMIENAREIEAARALGDLRENSEFKFAQEKRSRLQSELKTLSDLLSQARIITPEDVHPEEANIGGVVEVVDGQGKKTTYTILGPWDANADDNVLSFNSKYAQAMIGKKKGDTFQFKDEEYKVMKVGSIFDKKR